MGRAEVFLWMLVALLIVIVNVAYWQQPRLSNDSIQYVNVARHIAAGEGVQTSIIHFDVERAHHEVPAPLTTFPPGYSAVLAVLSFSGLTPEWAGLISSVACYLAFVPLVWLLASWFELSLAATRIALFALLVNVCVSLRITMVETEPLFTVLTLGAVILLLHCAAQVYFSATADKEIPWRDWIAAGVLIGLSYWVRYAGLFLLAATMILAAAAVFFVKRRDIWKPLSTVAIAGALTAPIMLRNIGYTGSWKGGNTKSVVHPLREFLLNCVATTYNLALGNLAPARIGWLEIAFACGLVVAVVIITVKLTPRFRSLRFNSRIGAGVIVVALFLGVYTAAMCYLGLFSVISFGGRMFYPILPLLILALAWAITETWTRVAAAPAWRAAFGMALIVTGGPYSVLSVRSMFDKRDLQSSTMAFQELQKYFDEETPQGERLSAWMQENVPEDGTVIAADGQATAYALDRNTVSLAPLEYSDQVWTEAAIRDLMSTYHSEVLILYPSLDPARAGAQAESEFLKGLLAGSIPSWLTVAAETPDVRIYRRSQTAQYSPSAQEAQAFSLRR